MDRWVKGWIVEQTDGLGVGGGGGLHIDDWIDTPSPMCT